jgi:hypothetical protein
VFLSNITEQDDIGKVIPNKIAFSFYAKGIFISAWMGRAIF